MSQSGLCWWTLGKTTSFSLCDKKQSYQSCSGPCLMTSDIQSCSGPCLMTSDAQIIYTQGNSLGWKEDACWEGGDPWERQSY